ncbi:MAG: hypothetical protein B7Y39_05220 [Bdellovibrio sp. 28-41-41]|nr:MAG: hypothetical protein B7Y39_05220 [Bdellovibrio sp. 28-41-41]
MQSFVMTTFVIILAFSFINLLVSLSIYASSRRPLYARTGLFWLTLIINFFIQSQAQNGEFLIILGVGFSIIPLNFLAYASLFFSGAAYPSRILIPLSIVSLILTFAIKDLPISFTLKALPFSIATALPLLYTVYIYLLKKRERTTKLMYVNAVVLTLVSMHCFNFAFFRMEPEAQLWGWPVAYGLYQILAMLIPAMTLEFYHDEEQSRLKMEVEKRTRELEIKNQDLNTLAKENQMLLNILVHDISNPIQVIMGFGNKLSLEKLPADLHKKHQRFTRALEAVFETLRTVREYHGAKLGKIVPTLKVVSVVEPIMECISLYEDKIKEKNIQMVFNQEEGKDILLKTDVSWIKNQIFANIISNAIKFSPVGGVINITFRLSRVDESVKIRVRDYGVGISNELKEYIFSASKVTTKLGTSGEKGTGLGMPIAKEYVDRLGGKIEILNLEPEEKGTCFELEFKTYDESKAA